MLQKSNIHHFVDIILMKCLEIKFINTKLFILFFICPKNNPP